MNKDRIIEPYRRHKLLSTLHEGKYKGRVWKEKELLTEIEGESIDDVLSKLRNFVDTQFIKTAESRETAPSAERYMKAFQTIISDLPDSHISMLKAHYHAPNQEITATALAAAVGYANYGAANLQYGTLGKNLYEELPIILPKRSDGSLIFTYMLATGGDQDSSEEFWVWKMRPEVASAIEHLGLNI